MADDYRVLPVHPDFRGPSGEPHQIEVDGVVTRVTLFHGKADEELDWHVFLSLDPDDASRIAGHLRDNGHSVSDALVAGVYCELMVIDDWHRRGPTWPPWQASFQRRYDTADLTPALRLEKAGSAHPAHALAKPVADEPSGKAKDLSASSRLVRSRISMQGLLVLDVGKDPDVKVEIHPPDGIAFPLDESGRVLAAAEGDDGWPARVVRWRVAWFGNSGHHRVNDESPLKQERTTTWYLPLPTEAARDPSSPLEIETESIRLWDDKADKWYESRGVRSLEPARDAIDPRDRRRKLRVSATMAVPGDRGGLVVRDYVVRALGDSGPAVTAGGPHVLDVFVRGKGGDDLVHRFWDGREWSGWLNPGGDLASAPAVVAGGPHVLDVFVRGKHDDDLVHRFFDGSEWSGWLNLGGDLASAPAVTAAGPHALDVFVRGKDGDLVHRFWHEGEWSGWNNLGGDLA
jgi:hypothetical protein